ncbi:MAG: DUF1302 family protein [Campylobacterota bacterium]|nr:DUF1302 family protein [Campylobacterota bacterium]
MLLRSFYATVVVATSLYANDGFDDEFEDGEFADESIELVQTTPVKKSDHRLNGSLTFSTSYNYKHHKPLNNTLNDFRGVSSAKLSSDIEYGYNIDDNYKLNSTLKLHKDFIYDLRDYNYKTTPEDYDSDIDLNELYIQGKLSDKTDITIGRQIVVWGKSDNIRITDTLNPLNNTTPGMVDIKDLRLGTAMTKVDHYYDIWSVSGIVIHENRYSSIPKYGSDFALSSQISANNISVDEPSNGIKNSGVAINVQAQMQGEDIAFYVSNKYADNTNYRSNMIGIAYNKVIDSFLLKTEAAYFDNYDSSTVDSKTDGLVGVEYSGISEGSISLEVANKDKNIQYALRFTQSYLNQTLDFTALAYMHGKDMKEGGFTRLWLDYDIDDSFQTSFGVIYYQGGDKANFEMIKDNDRVFASLKYSF